MERVEQCCIVLQSVVNNWAPTKSRTPENMPIEAPLHHKNCQVMSCGCVMSSDNHTNKQINMHMDTERDSLGCPVVCW